jgi:PAS domain S-box-containing protein
MSTYYSLYLDGLFFGIVIALYLIIRLWGLIKTPGANYLIGVIWCVVIWSFAYILEISLKDFTLKSIFSVITYLGISFLPLTLFSFALSYAGRGRWLTNSRFLLLAILPALTFLLAATNNLHGLMWSEVSMPIGNPVGPLLLTPGPWDDILIVYAYAFILAAIFFLAQIAAQSHNLYRYQARIMLIGTILPWIVNILYIAQGNRTSALDWTPFAFTLTGIALEIGFVRYGLMDILPVAQGALFNAMRDGIIVADEKGRIVEINPAAQRILKRQGDRLIGTDIRQILPAWIAWKTEAGNAAETTHEISMGEVPDQRCYGLRLTPLTGRHGQVTGRLVTLSDITEQKQAEDQMREAHEDAMEANRLKTQLLASVSHDLRTPLGAIMGYAEMIQAGAFGKVNDKQEHAAAEILESANQLLVFVNNLISQAQIETGRVVLRKEPFEPEELTGAVRATISYIAQKKKLGLRIETDENLPTTLLGDAYWLRQILLNLANNAVKFTEKGSVTIRFYLADNLHWALQVADTGIGIPPEEQARVFEPFHQIETSPSRRHSGSGLGLSIVHELVTLMGGEITLQSELGAGSKFTVILPLSAATPNETKTSR